MKINNYDKIIIGAGLYGLYSAERCGRRGERILVLECDDGAFKRATFINQARVHMGYHYPRSYSTAIKSAGYFKRFNEDYGFCVNKDFRKVYATSKEHSLTDAMQFKRFCRSAEIDCMEIDTSQYFKENLCDGAFITTEYTYDAMILRDYFLERIEKMDNVEVRYGQTIENIIKEKDRYSVYTKGNKEADSTSFLLNTTYASTNQIIDMLGYEPFKIKYELCEMIICKAGEKLKDVGITVMDGPFFSIMPFGKTGFHSLTSVTFTPHMTSYDRLPKFECQQKSNGYCLQKHLGNCNECPAKPKSAWPYMSRLAKKYLKEDIDFEYICSYFSMKPILKASEIDDSRPTVIKVFSKEPTFVSVLSGKINTVYDLDEVLDNGK